jgi:hypothetical protein
MSKLQAVVTKTSSLLEKLGPEKLEQLSKQLDISFDEHFIWQNKKSELVASGKISLDDGMFLFGVLGSSKEVFNGQSAAVKYVVSQFMLIVLKPS